MAKPRTHYLDQVGNGQGEVDTVETLPLLKRDTPTARDEEHESVFLCLTASSF